MRLGLRGRIVLLVLVALAPPTVIALGVALEERDEARTRVQGEVLDHTRVVAADVRRVIDATESFLAAVSHYLARRRGDDHCQRLLAIVPRATEWYSSVGVAGPGGRISCGTNARGFARPMQPIDVSSASWFRDAQRSGRFTMGNIGVGPLASTEVLIMSHPVPGRGGARPSVLFAGLDVRRLARSTALSHPPRDTAFVVLDDRGTVVARVPQMNQLIGHSLPDRPLVENVLRERQGTAEVKGLDGVERLHAFAPVGGVAGDQLFITAGRSSASIFADPNADLRRFLLLAGLGVLLALALSWLATRFLLHRWTSAVVASARRFGGGDLTARAPVPPQGFGELTDVAQALNKAAEDIERRQREQARLLAELVAAEEETRRRIAADIHDDTAQAVAAAGLRIDALVAELRDPEAREVAANARRSLADANRRLRRLLFELRPPALDEAGLSTALELFLADSFGEDGFDWRVNNRLEGEPSPEIRAILYRVALEALTNVRKHANAGMVDVLLERREAGVALRVQDDGAGFDLPAPDAPPRPGHIGLVTMRERAEAAGGRFWLSSAPGEGTVVDFWMPEPNGEGRRPL